MLSKILFALIGIVALLLAYAAFQPSEYTIYREISINKSPAAIFPYLNNSKLMNEWSPWSKMDPELQMNYSGPDAGVGSIAAWDSKGQMGTGSAVIIESISNEVVRTKLEYMKPFQMVQEAALSIRASGTESVVRWSVSGHNGFMNKLVCVFMDMDKMVGDNFESGLKELKTKVEALP